MLCSKNAVLASSRQALPALHAMKTTTTSCCTPTGWEVYKRIDVPEFHNIHYVREMLFQVGWWSAFTQL